MNMCFRYTSTFFPVATSGQLVLLNVPDVHTKLNNTSTFGNFACLIHLNQKKNKTVWFSFGTSFEQNHRNYGLSMK